MLLDVVVAISKLKLNFTERGKEVSRTRDNFFCGYIENILLLHAAEDQ